MPSVSKTSTLWVFNISCSKFNQSDICSTDLSKLDASIDGADRNFVLAENDPGTYGSGLISGKKKREMHFFNYCDFKKYLGTLLSHF